MAGSYSNNQPDFTWLNPYETKCFSQFWYPIVNIGKASFATLDAAVRVAPEDGVMMVQTTKAHKHLKVVLRINEQILFEGCCQTVPCVATRLTFAPSSGLYTVDLTADDGEKLLSYTQEKPDEMHYPEPVALDPHPATLKTVQELYLQGVHKDQYRNPQIEPCVYYEEALRRDPDHIPSLIALGEYNYRRGHFRQAKTLLEKAVRNEHIYNARYQDGEAEYLLALTLDALHETDKAYDAFYAAAWSGATIAKAMCKLAAIDGRRGDYRQMLTHAQTALEAAARHPIASSYAALAQYKLGCPETALALVNRALVYDPLNDLAIYMKSMLEGRSIAEMEIAHRSDFGQTCLDIAYDLTDAGFYGEAFALLTSMAQPTTPLIGYTAAWLGEKMGQDGSALRAQAAKCPIKTSYPYRLSEIAVLEAALADGQDAAARNLLACVLYDKGHFDRAIALWQEACRLDQQNAVYLRNCAVALFSHGGRKEEAMALLLRAMELAPENDQLKLEYLYAANKLGVPGEKRLEVIRTHPLNGKAMDDYVLEHAKAYLTAGKYDEALKVLYSHEFVPAEGGEMAITSLYFTIMLHKGRTALAQGNYEEALELLTKAPELPANLHSGLWAEADLTPLIFYQAEALEALGRTEESQQKYAQCIAHMLPSKIDLPFYYASAMRKLNRCTDARVLLSRVTRNLEERSMLPAIGWEDMIAAFNPFMNNPQEQREGMIAYQLAMLQKYDGNFEQARSLFEKSRRLWPEYMNTWMELNF